MRLGPRDARVLLWAEDSRVYVMWRSSAHWDAIRRSLREWFPRHGQLNYDGGRQRWSVPLTERERLEHWLGAMFTRGVTEWVDADPGSFSNSRTIATGNHTGQHAGRVA